MQQFPKGAPVSLARVTVFMLVCVITIYFIEKKFPSVHPASVPQEKNVTDRLSKPFQPAQNDTGAARAAKPQNELAVYIPYSPAALELTRTKQVVLFFYSEACEPCKQSDTILQSITRSDVPASLVVLRVNVDDDPLLAAVYGIKETNSFVALDQTGAARRIWTGISSVDELLKNTYPMKSDTLKSTNNPATGTAPYLDGTI